MASSPCDCWPHLSQTHSSSSIEHVWNDIKLASLSNFPVDLDFNNNNNNHNHSVSVSSFLNQPPSTFLSLTSTSSSSSVFHKRHTRVIKNRESAVRSRARKQAYRKGLEVETARLTEKNSRLKRQLKEENFVPGFKGKVSEKLRLFSWLDSRSSYADIIQAGNGSEVYIVYMGAANSTKDSLRDDHAYVLNSVLTRHEKDLVRNFKHGFSGFAVV